MPHRWMLLALLIGCDKVKPARWHDDDLDSDQIDTGTRCRAEETCDARDGWTCRAPDADVCPDGCTAPKRECEVNEDCGRDMQCHVFEFTCSCGGESSECKPYCKDSTECDANETCGENGVCALTSCETDWVCDPGTACLGGTIDHGCVRLSCDDDADCGGDLYCVEDYCYETLGTCAPS